MSEPKEYHVAWSAEDQEYVATTPLYPSMSFLHKDPLTALFGLIYTIREEVRDMEP